MHGRCTTEDGHRCTVTDARPMTCHRCTTDDVSPVHGRCMIDARSSVHGPYTADARREDQIARTPLLGRRRRKRHPEAHKPSDQLPRPRQPPRTATDCDDYRDLGSRPRRTPTTANTAGRHGRQLQRTPRVSNRPRRSPSTVEMGDTPSAADPPPTVEIGDPPPRRRTPFVQ